MNSAPPLKTEWTWEEWQATRAARRAAADRVAPPVLRRRESSSDRRLRPAFKGERGPAFGKRPQGRTGGGGADEASQAT